MLLTGKQGLLASIVPHTFFFSMLLHFEGLYWSQLILLTSWWLCLWDHTLPRYLSAVLKSIFMHGAYPIPAATSFMERENRKEEANKCLSLADEGSW